MAKVIIISQARIESKRFRRKILEEINGESLLAIHLKRLKKSNLTSSIIVATTFEKGVEEIISIASEQGVKYFQGSTENVLDRFYQSVKIDNPDYIVRVTSDCPLIDGELIDSVIKSTIERKVDYCSNALIESYPDGQDIEVIKWRAFEYCWQNSILNIELEHVTPFIRKNCDFNGGSLFSSSNFESSINYGHIRMTVDEPSDFKAIEVLVNNMGVDREWEAYTKYIIENPLKFKNQKILRNEGYLNSIKKNDING
jgi:spore coat polysaccharide biosynthesis protein SpsF (cytidylyltransferase family)